MVQEERDECNAVVLGLEENILYIEPL